MVSMRTGMYIICDINEDVDHLIDYSEEIIGSAEHISLNEMICRYGIDEKELNICFPKTKPNKTMCIYSLVPKDYFK